MEMLISKKLGSFPVIFLEFSLINRRFHYCAATLLAKPPKPTVLVTAAHCTFICKSNLGVVDNCCCKNVGNIDCSDDFSKCGSNPTTIEMDGDD